MRSFLICVLFGVSFATPPVFEFEIEPAIFEDQINETVNNIISDLPDPLTADDFPITLPDDSTLLTGSADLSNLEVTGLQSSVLSHLNFDILAFHLNLTLVIEHLNINTDYTGDLLLAELLPLYGTGKANIHLTDLEVNVDAGVDLSNGLAVKDVKTVVYLGSSTFDIHGALDNEDFSNILSDLLNDVVTSFIDNYQDVISNILSPILEDIINSVLGSINTDTTTSSSVTVQ